MSPMLGLTRGRTIVPSELVRSRGGVEYERQANASAGQLQGNVAQQLQKYERGENRISTGRLQRAAEVLGVPVTFLRWPGYRASWFAFGLPIH